MKINKQIKLFNKISETVKKYIYPNTGVTNNELTLLIFKENLRAELNNLKEKQKNDK